MHRSRSFVLSLLCAAPLLLAIPARAEEPRVHRVSIKGMVFVPATLEVRVGDTIEWTNDDFVPHTVTATGGAAFDSRVLPPKARFRFVVETPGEQPYVCTLHPGMKAGFTAAK